MKLWQFIDKLAEKQREAISQRQVVRDTLQLSVQNNTIPGIDSYLRIEWWRGYIAALADTLQLVSSVDDSVSEKELKANADKTWCDGYKTGKQNAIKEFENALDTAKDALDD